MSEGIYDLDRLLVSFPTYKDWFIANAFGDEPSYAGSSPTNYPLRGDAGHISWFIIHSHVDTLVDIPQSQGMYDHLRTLYHSIGCGEAVEKDWETIRLEHNDMLKTDAYSGFVGGIISQMVRKGKSDTGDDMSVPIRLSD